jgi:hypothetical protein
MTHRHAALLVLLLPGAALADPAVPVFAEETEAAGFAHSYTGEWEFMVGGGVAVFDCSGDGLPEIFAAGGASPASLFLNGSQPGGTLAFTRAESGLELTGVTGPTRSTSTGTAAGPRPPPRGTGPADARSGRLPVPRCLRRLGLRRA